jgi:hypothetical protein
MSFFDFCVTVFPYSGPLRPPMWGGEPVKGDPERTVAAAVRNGGDEVHRGVSPSAPQQSAADAGQMKPVEPDIDVRVMANIYHIVDDHDGEYEVTRVEIEAVATVKVNDERLHISHHDAIEAEMWNLDINEVKTIVTNVENIAAEKAFDFLKMRRELLEVLKSLKVEIMQERVVGEEYFDDDP